MLKSFVKLFGGDPNKKTIEDIRPIVDEINRLETHFEALSDEALRAKTDEFRARIAESMGDVEGLDEKEQSRVGQEALNEVLPEAFATVREASKRTIGLRHFDVQMIGGVILHRGSIAEMRTGEGKTLVATLPIYLNALLGKGIHLVTVNDYLARRDARWMAPIYQMLGLSVGVLQMAAATENGKKAFLVDFERESPHEDQRHLRLVDRRLAYETDVTYGTNSEFGFDYLRDNMTMRLSDRVQRGHHYAIVDEVDNVLIDEARTPLIISGPASGDVEWYGKMAQVVKQLRPEDYELNEKDRNVTITEVGLARVEQMLGQPLMDPDRPEDVTPEQARLRGYLEQALRAQYVFHRNKDYLVQAGKVVIVDEFTGRLMPGRRWSDGLHQAVEAKEGVRVQAENVTYATITIQNYFRMYAKLAGMTGTAETEETEFFQIYKLEVVVIPTNRPVRRGDKHDLIYKTRREKYNAIVGETERQHKRGLPVLVGTVSVEVSETLSRMLKRRGMKHEVLNAKYHEREAEIVAQAGQPGAITIATNMAGRGTDIKLGPGVKQCQVCGIRARGEPAFGQAIEHADLTAERIKELNCNDDPPCGLVIVGTERHEARRIDRQLRGRSGRQGDPGGSVFYLSLEDDLMRLFGSDRIARWMDRGGAEEGEVITHPWGTGAISQAQKRVELQNFQARKRLLEYDDVMNQQREVMYSLRLFALEGGEELKAEALRMIDAAVERLVDERTT